jgi:hypothetical protein
MEEYPNVKRKIFTWLRTGLIGEVLDRCESDSLWANVCKAIDDPLSLWKLIVRAMATVGRKDSHCAELKFRDALSRCRQGSKSIDDYRSEFMGIIHGWTLLDIQPESDELLVDMLGASTRHMPKASPR